MSPPAVQEQACVPFLSMTIPQKRHSEPPSSMSTPKCIADTMESSTLDKCWSSTLEGMVASQRPHMGAE
eukprot:1370490-Karenia_brevis.AAC.1